MSNRNSVRCSYKAVCLGCVVCSCVRVCVLWKSCVFVASVVVVERGGGGARGGVCVCFCACVCVCVCVCGMGWTGDGAPPCPVLGGMAESSGKAGVAIARLCAAWTKPPFLGMVRRRIHSLCGVRVCARVCELDKRDGLTISCCSASRTALPPYEAVPSPGRSVAGRRLPCSGRSVGGAAAGRHEGHGRATDGSRRVLARALLTLCVGAVPHSTATGMRRRRGRWLDMMRTPMRNTDQIWMEHFSSEYSAKRPQDGGAAAAAVRGQSDDI